MKIGMLGVVAGSLACGLVLAIGGCAASGAAKTPTAMKEEPRVQLGNFSVSLAVKDLAASRGFYEKLGFRMIAGNQKTYVIMQNDTSTIGLFQGMFDKNILTFNPGWDRACNTLASYQDVREIQKELRAKGLTPSLAVDEATSGPGSVVLTDPDGNQILIDQHVGSPKK